MAPYVRLKSLANWVMGVPSWNSSRRRRSSSTIQRSPACEADGDEVVGLPWAGLSCAGFLRIILMKSKR